MAQPNLIRISETGGTLAEVSAFGRVYSVRNEDGLTREDRAASGKLRRDVIARKKNFTLSYELVDQETLDQFVALFDINNTLTVEITHLTVVRSYEVLMSPISAERLLAVHGGMWQGLVVELREV